MLLQEKDHLWRVERPEITQRVTEAAAQGDRSENADYQYNKRRLYQIDKRLRFLSKRMDELEVVTPAPEQEGKVFFGAHVTVEDEQGEEATYQIVGPDEYDTKLGRISVDSPMARALLGKQEGDEVKVQRPKKAPATVAVVEIWYEAE